MLQGLSTDVEDAEEFIGRLRCFNEVLAEMPRTYRVTEREREICLEAEWNLAAALEQGRPEECWTHRSRAEATAELVVTAIAARPHVRPEFKHVLRTILHGGEAALSPDLLTVPAQGSPTVAVSSRFGVAPAYEPVVAGKPRPAAA